MVALVEPLIFVIIKTKISNLILYLQKCKICVLKLYIFDVNIGKRNLDLDLNVTFFYHLVCILKTYSQLFNVNQSNIFNSSVWHLLLNS